MDDLPPLPTSPRGLRRGLIEIDRAVQRARRASLRARSWIGARRAGASLALQLHPTAVVGRGVVIEAWEGTRNAVTIGAGARLQDHAWISMRGGSLVIGRGTDVRRGVTVTCSGSLSVGEEAVLSTGVHLHCAESLSIDDWTIIGEHSTVADSWHLRTPSDQPVHHATEASPVHIGRNIWIGAKVTVAAGVTVGDDAIVAAGAVVTRDVRPATLVAGVPARVVRSLGDPPAAAGP